MYDPFSIWKNEVCPVCDGLKVIEVINSKCTHTNEEFMPCEYCDGRGYLKILKSDYDY